MLTLYAQSDNVLIVQSRNVLFMYERHAWDLPESKRVPFRKAKEAPIIDQLIERAKHHLADPKLLPKSPLKKALGYLIGLTPHLKNYTTSPAARLDNNVAERAIRPLALGRKNWLFVGSERGGEAGAIIYSIVQSAKATGINPREYLEDIMRRINSHNSQKLHELLPDQWAKARADTDTS